MSPVTGHQTYTTRHELRYLANLGAHRPEMARYESLARLR